MATVVVTFPDPPVSGSTVRAAWVIHASVFTGGISDTALTMVVLPTPNPPATTILAEASRGALAGELVKPIDDSLQEAGVVGGGVGLGVDDQPVAGGHVAEEHPGHAERDAAVRGELGDRLDRGVRPVVQRAGLGREQVGVAGVVVRHRDQGVHVQPLPGAGPAAGEHVGAHPRVGARGAGAVRRRHGAACPVARPRRSSRSRGVSTWPTLSTSRVIWWATAPSAAPSRTSTASPASPPIPMNRKCPVGNLSMIWSHPGSSTCSAMLRPRLSS